MIESSVSADDRSFTNLRPEPRSDALIRHYDNEAVAWSPISRHPTHLDAVAALVFQMLDGTASVADLIADVHEVIGIPESLAANQIRRVIGQLEGAGLLTMSAAQEVPDAELGLFPAPPNP